MPYIELPTTPVLYEDRGGSWSPVAWSHYKGCASKPGHVVHRAPCCTLTPSRSRKKFARIGSSGIRSYPPPTLSRFWGMASVTAGEPLAKPLVRGVKLGS